MPSVTVKAIGPKTIDQKRALAKDITDAVVKNYGVKPESVTIDFVDISKENLSIAGKLFIDR